MKPRCSHRHPHGLLCDLPAGHPGDHANTRLNLAADRSERTCWTDDGATWKDRTA